MKWKWFLVLISSAQPKGMENAPKVQSFMECNRLFELILLEIENMIQKRYSNNFCSKLVIQRLRVVCSFQSDS